MKKALTKVLLTAITLVIFAAIIPLSASASTSNNKSEVYKQLTTKLNLNSAAACGIMANIERESKFNPELIVIDSNGRQSGGLCQWNGGRFANLKNYCNKNGYDYLSIDGQIAYLLHELKSNAYGYIYDYLKGVSNDGDGAYDAAWYWCYYFEIPSNRSEKAKQRGYTAENDYWPVYGEVDLKAPSLSLQNKKSPYDIDNTISFKWSDGGDDVTHYYLYVATKNSKGKYDWNNAKVGKYSASTTVKNVAGKTVSKGDHAAYVKAYDSNTGKTVKSNYTEFSVKCLSHQYQNTKVLKAATYDATGTMQITCKQCGAKSTKAIAKLTDKDFTKSTLTGVKVYGYNDTKIGLSWKTLKGADGYQIYQMINSKWTRIATVKGGSTSQYIVSGLKPGTKCTFNVRAYRNGADGKTHVSIVQSPVKAATRPAAPTLKTAAVAGSKAVKLNWAKLNGVDGYAVYASVGKNSTNYKHVATINGNGTITYTVKNLKPGQIYNFTVKSFIKTTNGYAVSKASAAKSIVAK